MNLEAKIACNVEPLSAQVLAQLEKYPLAKTACAIACENIHSKTRPLSALSVKVLLDLLDCLYKFHNSAESPMDLLSMANSLSSGFVFTGLGQVRIFQGLALDGFVSSQDSVRSAYRLHWKYTYNSKFCMFDPKFQVFYEIFRSSPKEDNEQATSIAFMMSLDTAEVASYPDELYYPVVVVAGCHNKDSLHRPVKWRKGIKIKSAEQWEDFASGRFQGWLNGRNDRRYPEDGLF